MKNIALMKIIALLLLCTGCASFGKGVTEAIMDRETGKPKECRIYSGGFEGVNSAFNKHTGDLKIINVHGIGEHAPGYALSMANTLADKMGLLMQAADYKEITLTDPSMPDTNIGSMRVYKRYSEDGKAMVFYEYSWSVLAKPLRDQLAFDSMDLNAAHRTEVNASFKNFFNAVAPDAVTYAANSEYQNRIQLGLNQVICWAFGKEWDDLPDRGAQTCSLQDATADAYSHKHVILASSMGSQIALDAIHWFTYKNIDNPDEYATENRIDGDRLDLQLILLANQIPLLSLGKELPPVNNRIDEFCRPGAKGYDYRFINKLEIVAFSDPNDILTYSLAPEFISHNIDSRLCPDISNIILNVTSELNIASLKFANPYYAHMDYGKSEQLLDLIINGTQPELKGADPVNGCRWYELH